MSFCQVHGQHNMGLNCPYCMDHSAVKTTFKSYGIPGFKETLDKVLELHVKKNSDYATKENPFSNFDFTAETLKEFKNSRDQAFVWPIATKLSRLGNLLSNDKNPNNESIEDSFDDIITYTILWKLDYIRRNKPLVFKMGDPL